MFGFANDSNDIFGRFGGVEAFDEVRTMREHGESGEDVEVCFVIGRTNEKEMTRTFAVGSTEEDGTNRAAVADERLFEEIRIVKARMQEGDTRADGGRRRFFACLKFLEKRVGVVNFAAGFGEIRHVSENTGFRFRGDGEVNRGEIKVVGNAPIIAVRLTIFVHDHAMLFVQRPLVGGEDIPLSPLVQRTMSEEILLAALDGFDFAALCDVSQFVLREMNVLRRLL